MMTAKKLLPFQDDFQILAAVVRRQRKSFYVFHSAKSTRENILGVQAGPCNAFFMPTPAAKVNGKLKLR